MASSNSEPGHPENRSHSGISPSTLIIASVASVAASFAVARIWGPGTLLGAAAAPVIVALVSETMRRPMRTATATARKVPRPGRVASPDIPVPDAPDASGRPRWGLALATGLAAFAIVVGAFTVPDLLAGRSITGNGQPTTFFGGSGTIKKVTPTTSTSTHTTVTRTAAAKATRTVSAATTATVTKTATVSSSTPTSTQSTTGSASTTSTVSTASTQPTAAP